MCAVGSFSFFCKMFQNGWPCLGISVVYDCMAKFLKSDLSQRSRSSVDQMMSGPVGLFESKVEEVLCWRIAGNSSSATQRKAACWVFDGWP